MEKSQIVTIANVAIGVTVFFKWGNVKNNILVQSTIQEMKFYGNLAKIVTSNGARGWVNQYGSTLTTKGKGGLYLTAEAVQPIRDEDELEEGWG